MISFLSRAPFRVLALTLALERLVTGDRANAIFGGAFHSPSKCRGFV
jgi:hypothetical protein